MSSQSITEFTILNGRVTVTRASNHTRNDVNVTIVANGRRNDNPRRNCLCHREIRWRNRRRQGLDQLLRSLQDLNDHMHDATDDLVMAKQKLNDAREELDKASYDVKKYVNNLHCATIELDKAINDLQSTELYNLTEQENTILRLDIQLVENDLDEARKQIHEAKETVRNENPAHLVDNVGKASRSSILRFNKDGEASTSANNLTVTYSPYGRNINDNRNKCSVCLENPVNCVLYTCGHMCMCYMCALKLQLTSDIKKCPVCRKDIKDVIRTYQS